MKKAGIAILLLVAAPIIYAARNGVSAWTIYWWFSDISKALIPLALGLFGAWIAYQQRHNAQMKLKLDLYDRRSVVYQELVEVMDIAFREPQLLEQLLHKFTQRIHKERFLFRDPVFQMLIDIKMQCDGVAATCNPATIQLLESHTLRNQHQAWLADQDKRIQDHFREYLDLSNMP